MPPRSAGTALGSPACAQRDVTPPSARNSGWTLPGFSLGGSTAPLEQPPARISLLLSLQLEYAGASPVQLRFLRLHSHRATQKVSYSCRAAPERGRPQPHKEILFLADSRDHSYAASLQGCLVSLALPSLCAWKRLPTFGEPLGECLTPCTWDGPGG